jgi:ankyrin repeat protein
MGQQSSKTAPSSGPSASSATLLNLSMEGDIDGVKKLMEEHLIEQGCTIDKDGLVQSDQAAALLEKYVNTSGDAQNNTPLHGAVFGGHLEIVKFLCATCHANILQKNEVGCSPLWLAAGYNHDKVMVYILERILLLEEDNGNDNERCPSVEHAILQDANSTGDTPFIAAASRGNIETCTTLLDMVSRSTSKLGGGSAALAMLLVTNHGGDTALAVAVGAGHEDVLELILEWVPKCFNEQLSPQQQTAVLLNQRNKQGLTPLLAACERGNAKIVNRLLQAGAEFLPDEKGASPLSVVSFCGHQDVANVLLALPNGATTLLNQQDEPSGCTALWHAARTGNVAMVEYFLEQGADASIANNEGLTPEQVAIKFKKQAVVDVFSNVPSKITQQS